MSEYQRSGYTSYDNFNDKFDWKVITRDILIFVGLIVFFMSLTPRQKEAPPVNENAALYQYVDGNTKITQIMTDSSVTSESSTGTKQYVFFDTLSSEHGTTRWELNLTGTFAEKDGNYVCVFSNADFISYNTTFFEKDMTVTTVGNEIHCNITVGKRFFYIPTSEFNFEFVLTCNPDGTLS